MIEMILKPNAMLARLVISRTSINPYYHGSRQTQKSIMIPVGCIPVSEEQKASFDITNDRTVHTPDYLLAHNALLKLRLQASRYSAIFITKAAFGGWDSVSE